MSSAGTTATSETLATAGSAFEVDFDDDNDDADVFGSLHMAMRGGAPLMSLKMFPVTLKPSFSYIGVLTGFEFSR